MRTLDYYAFIQESTELSEKLIVISSAQRHKQMTGYWHRLVGDRHCCEIRTIRSTISHSPAATANGFQ